MKNILLFLLKALLFMFLIFVAKGILQPLYRNVVTTVGSPFFHSGNGVTLYFDSFDKIVPFVGLLLATPKVPMFRQLFLVAAGLSVFIIADVSTLFFTDPTNPATGAFNTSPDMKYMWAWEMYGRWLLPVLLWLVTCNKYMLDMLQLENLHSRHEEI